MRITITLGAADEAVFRGLMEQPENQLVQPAVLARHYFQHGMKAIALSRDRHETLVRNTPELSAAAAKSRTNRKGGKR